MAPGQILILLGNDTGDYFLLKKKAAPRAAPRRLHHEAIWLCLALVAGILFLTGYSTGRVRGFAGELTAQLDTAVEALHDDDLPAAHQAILKGAALCKEMRQGSVLYLRTEDFSSWRPACGLPPAT